MSEMSSGDTGREAGREAGREVGRVDESSFGLGGESSAEADVDAAKGRDPDEDVPGGAPVAEGTSADETVSDSHTADIDAGYDDPKDSPATGTDVASESAPVQRGY